jgi:uncharacterized protein YndB with AHSA1/START domain
MSQGERSGVKISRDFDFPRATVFNMFTDSRKAAKWWGPKESVSLVFEVDPRPGGAMRIDDRHPDGTVFQTTGTILELVVPELFVYRSSTKRGDEPARFEALQTVTFEELSPKRTRVTALVKVLSLGSWPGDVDSLEEGFEGGWAESFQRLHEVLG